MHLCHLLGHQIIQIQITWNQDTLNRSTRTRHHPLIGLTCHHPLVELTCHRPVIRRQVSNARFLITGDPWSRARVIAGVIWAPIRMPGNPKERGDPRRRSNRVDWYANESYNELWWCLILKKKCCFVSIIYKRFISRNEDFVKVNFFRV